MSPGASWSHARLGSLIEAKYGKALPHAERSGGEVPVYGSNGIVGRHDRAITKGASIIIGRKGSSGAVNFSPVPCWPIDTAYFIDDPGPYSIGFLVYLLRSLSLIDLDRSTAIPGLNREQFYGLSVPVPALDEQNAIVTLLSCADRLSGRATQHLSTSKRAIERCKQAVLAAACSGRLTGEWRLTHPSESVELAPPLTPAAIKNSSNSPNTDELLDIPDSWAWWSIESITDQVIDYRGRTPPSEPSGPIPHVRTTQIRDGRVDWNTDRYVTQDVYERYMTRGIPLKGDVLFTMEAPMGSVGLIDRDDPFSIAQRILLLRPGTGLTGEYLSLALRSFPVQQAIEFRATGSGVQGIAYKRLRSVLIPRPPLEEQAEIIRRADQLLGLAELATARIDLASRRVESTSQALLAKAFNGELIGKY